MTNTPIHILPDQSAEEFARAARKRSREYLFRAFTLALVVGASFVALGLDSMLVPMVVMIGVVILIILWQDPRVLLYVVFASVCLFELFPTYYKDGLTDHVPFFWNINSIFQVYMHAESFKAVPLNLFEVLLLICAAISFVRSVYTGGVHTEIGPLFRPIFIYIIFVTIGWIHGITSGGDFKISLMEVRAQFYLLLAYLMVVNIVRERKQLTAFLWIMIICVGIKGILYTFRRYVTLAGLPLPDQGVGSHEEAFFFDAFAVMLLVMVLCGVRKHMQRVMWFFLPLVITGNLATNRRAGTAAIVIAIPALMLSAYTAFPNRRRLIAIGGIAGALLFTVYYQAFKNSESLYAQPARAIKSQFAPDSRDALSNLYRDQENICLMTTVKLSPLFGYGYGKKMIHAVAMADISKTYEYWDVMTHNQILWIWMRVGTFGFIAFWMMVVAIIFYAGQLLRQPELPAEAKAIALFVVLTTFMLMVFGGLDLQFSNQRDMLFIGFWSGILVVLPRLYSIPVSGNETDGDADP